MGLNENITIDFAGGYFEDIVLYLMRISQNLGYKTMIVDNTINHRFYPLVSHINGIDPIDSVIDHRGVGYTYGNGLNKEKSDELGSCDCIYKLYDIRGYVPDGGKCIFITDESKRFLDILESFKNRQESMLIIRDYTGVVQNKLDMIAENGGFGSVYALPISLKDRKAAVRSEHRDICRFSSVSKEMKALLLKLQTYIFPDKTEKELKKAFRSASKGVVA